MNVFPFSVYSVPSFKLSLKGGETCDWHFKKEVFAVTEPFMRDELKKFKGRPPYSLDSQLERTLAMSTPGTALPVHHELSSWVNFHSLEHPIRTSPSSHNISSPVIGLLTVPNFYGLAWLFSLLTVLASPRPGFF